jgi:phosphopantetheinyl transferase (holo-ACP synthase)
MFTNSSYFYCVPLIKEKTVTESSKLFIWKVAPEELSNRSWIDSNKPYSEKRIVELCGMRMLTKHAGVPQIKYLENGKPVLDSGHISFSHCSDVVGMMLSDKPVGLDIQKPTEKLLRIRERFCNSRELDLAGDSLEDLTIIWSTKEAVFKVYGENVAFGEQMNVLWNGEHETHKCVVSAPYDRTFSLQREWIEEHLVVYTL